MLGIIRTSIPEPGRRNLVVAYINALERELDRAREKAITDELTGIDNRRAFEIALKRMISRSLKIQVSPTFGDKVKSIFTCITKGWDYPISCVMTDIDHFKKVNDTYGHQTGDAALRFFAQFFHTNLTDTDTVGRFGGEEFIIGLEDVNSVNTYNQINELREAIKKNPVNENVTLKFSAGISSSEHNPEIVLLYSKKIMGTFQDYLNNKPIAQPLLDIAKRLHRKPEVIEQWFINLREAGQEFITRGFKGDILELVTRLRSDFACFIFEQRADQALYRAKQTGRDKVCVWTPEGIVESAK